jgi:Glycosyl hydrolases family 2, sugar binding domain/Concanavalin A-like lectin/glucanases superfamily/Glycosyl hydrolases family 2
MLHDRAVPRFALALGSALIVAFLGAHVARAGYRPLPPPLSTPWTAQVSPTRPLPEYPRPQLRRRRWTNLNGPWQFAPAPPGEPPPFGRRLPETILVPFPMQSALSGIGRYEERSWYRRTFHIPRGWSGDRVLLHFGAVTHVARVYVNGRQVGSHRGSYDAFTFDVTRALRRRTANELVVGVEDDIFGSGDPVGKQSPASFDVFYTASSGIWQTVWLEPVPRAHFAALDSRPEVARRRLVVLPTVTAGRGTEVLVRVRAGGRVVGEARGRPGRALEVRLPHPRLWSPADPFLYALDAALRGLRRGRVIDRVHSYAGMRSIGLARVGGVVRPVLNGRFAFQIGVLDQGFWPDGLYTAPTDAALRSDLVATKGLGFNTVRKHLKVEPQRWYYWADRLGLLVWQDMPNPPPYRPVRARARRQFEYELDQMVHQHRSSPAIAVWTVFNEGWGEWDVARLTDEVGRWDPSRLVDGQSGGANCCAAQEPPGGDLRDAHLYVGPVAVAPDRRRASVAGEFGGCERAVPGHVFPGTRPGAKPSGAANRGLLRRFYDALGQLMRTPGLSGAIFTQLTDVEREGKGLLSYDRRVLKCNGPLLRALNRRLIAASRTPAGLLPQRGAPPAGATGRWTFDDGRGAIARDSSGRGHRLALEGGARWTRGHRGAALELGGAGQRARAAGPVLDTSRSFSVSAWLRQDDSRQTSVAVGQGAIGDSGSFLGINHNLERPASRRGYFDNPGPPSPAGTWWLFSIAPTQPCAAVACRTRASLGYDDGRSGPLPGTWHQVTGVADRANRTVTLYIDGRPVDNRVAEGARAAPAPFTVGGGTARVDGGSFHGAVDDVLTWARPLSAADVWRLYAAQVRR